MNRKSKLVTLLSAIILSGLLTSCEDPYEGKTQGNLTVQAPDEQKIIRPTPGINFDQAIYDFTEGNEDIYPLKAIVSGKKAIITFLDLPEGAKYDSATGNLSWKPNFKVVDLEKDPGKTLKLFQVTALVGPADNPGIKDTYSIILRVNNSRNRTILTLGRTVSEIIDANEGSTVEKELLIESKDFPNGPFDVQISPRIQGMNWQVKDPAEPNKLAITFSPNFDAIKVQDCLNRTSGCNRKIQVKFTVTEPDNISHTITRFVQYRDVRQNPIVQIPENITIGLDGTMQIVAIDPNKEIAPTVEVVSNTTPEYGKFEVSSVAYKADMSTIATIKWTSIPKTFAGEQESVTFKICNYRQGDVADIKNPSLPKNCTRHTVRINVELEKHPAPALNRDRWPVNERKYLLVGEKFQRTLPIIIPNGEDTPDIKLVRPSLQAGPGQTNNNIMAQVGTLGKEVWINVEGKNPGPAQFSILMESSFGVQQSESFVFEVLPKDYSSILYLGDSKRGTENTNVEPNIENYQFINPINTELQFPTTLKRDTVVVGTDVIRESSLLGDDFYNNLYDKFKNVVYASPLIGELPEVVKRRFKELKVEVFDDRMLQKYTNVDMSKVELIPNRTQITNSKKTVSLKLNSTLESSNPNTIFMTSNSPCRAVMNLAFGQVEVPIAVVCDNARGGKDVLIGIEWGEFKLDQVDMASKLPQTWFKEIMNLEIKND